MRPLLSDLLRQMTRQTHGEEPLAAGQHRHPTPAVAIVQISSRHDSSPRKAYTVLTMPDGSMHRQNDPCEAAPQNSSADAPSSRCNGEETAPSAAGGNRGLSAAASTSDGSPDETLQVGPMPLIVAMPNPYLQISGDTSPSAVKKLSVGQRGVRYRIADVAALSAGCASRAAPN